MPACEAPRAYVIALLGTTPAVLTELIWWLVIEDELDVVGLEIWTTAGGPRSGEVALRAALAEGIWERLLDAIGDRRTCAPRPPPEVALLHATELPSIETAMKERAWQLVGLSHAGSFLEDVRSPDDAHAVARLFHERVRAVRGQLADDIVLVGSLAGGRKTMSAALQGAFELQARPNDRLVHVLAHPELERAKDFVVPDPSLTIPLDEQVRVYDVPFPLLRLLIQQSAAVKGSQIDTLFEHESYDTILGTLRRPPASVSARLHTGAGRRWTLEVLSNGARIGPLIPLKPMEAAVYAIVASNADGVSDEQIHMSLLERGLVAEAWDSADDNNASKRISRLVDTLAQLRSLGLGDLVPTGGPDRRVIPLGRVVAGLDALNHRRKPLI